MTTIPPVVVVVVTVVKKEEDTQEGKRGETNLRNMQIERRFIFHRGEQRRTGRRKRK